MHDLEFATVARPTRAIVLGIPMLTYSIGHELLLAGNDYALPLDEFAKLDDRRKLDSLYVAAEICSRDWIGNQEPARWQRLWRWRTRHCVFAHEATAFLDYRLMGQLAPPSPDPEASAAANGEKESDQQARQLGSPFLARLLSFVARLPLEGRTIYDYPLAKASFLYYAQSEEEGRIRIENEREAQAREELQAWRESVRQKQEEVCRP